jgi:hypothetical protein
MFCLDYKWFTSEVVGWLKLFPPFSQSSLLLEFHQTNALAYSTGISEREVHGVALQQQEGHAYWRPVTGSWQEDSTLRVATSPTTETNLAQFLPFYTQLASCGCPSQWVMPDKKRNGPLGRLQFLLGELEEDDRKRHIVTSLPFWYINFGFSSFLPEMTL